MAELLTQVAGMTKEVAVTYIILYGVLEILKTVVWGLVCWQGLKALGTFFKSMLDF